MATATTTFDPDKFLAETDTGFNPDKFLQETAPTISKEPAWYDVPGMFNQNAKKAISNIKTEADLAAQGKQSVLTGALYSAGHMAGMYGKDIGAVLSPLVSNPITKAILEGAAIVGNSGSPLSVAIANPQLRDTNQIQTPKYLTDIGNSFQAHPEWMNRIDSGIGLTNLPLVSGAMTIGKTIYGAAAKDAEKAALTSAGESGFKTVTPKISNEIPDIEKEPAPIPLNKTTPMTAKAVKNAAQEASQAPGAGILSTIDPKERNILAEPLTTKDTPFTDYALQAKKASLNAREMTPMDMAGTKAKSALDEIDKARQAVGKTKGDLLNKADDYAISNNNFVDASGIKDQWQSMLKARGGIAFDADGGIIPAAGRVNRISSELPMVKKIDDLVNQLPNEATPFQMDDTKAAIRDIVDNYKASQTIPQNTITEGIGKNIRSLIDDKLQSWSDINGFQDMAKASADYAKLSGISSQLSRRLGEVTDATTGQTRMGASLMKSAVMSNSDRGSKALFNAVKDVTGHDLIKDAMYAKVAMDAVGDTRATDLLQSAANAGNSLKDIAQSPTITGALLKVGGHGLDALRGDKLTQLINYYNKIHTASDGAVVPAAQSKSIGQMLNK